jgi:hypothetical protein
MPMDDRPVNYDYPRYLSRAAGLEVMLPPRELLGNPWRASRHPELVDWLAHAVPQADGAVIAIDALAYGGLIPSRTSTESVATVLGRLNLIKDLKAAHREKMLLASSTVMRICRNNSSEEEKPYWATYGSRMFRLSSLEHKTELGEATPAEKDEMGALHREIPDEVYDDYRRGRARNHAVNRAMLDWVEEGVFDYLLLPQDDTADYGWNVAEARSLQALIRARHLGERAITYPGADEVGCLLLARFACRQAGFAPKVWPRYSGLGGASVVTAYEDRPFGELLKAHLAPLGGIVAESPQDADLSLFINAPVESQGHGDSQWLILRGVDEVRKRLPPKFHGWLERFTDTAGYRYTRREMESPGRNPEEFLRALRSALGAGRPVALADVAYVNAADIILGELLRQLPQVTELAGYGGWNTAGNTLGTVLAQSVIRILALRHGRTREQEAAHLEFLFLRFLDDDLYQGNERTRCMVEDLPALDIEPTQEKLPDYRVAEIERRVDARLRQAAGELRVLFLQSKAARDVRIDKVHLPWRRLFEVGFDVKVEPGR